DASQLEEIIVNSLKLVGKRVNAGNGQAEVRIEFVSNAESVSLETQAQERSVPIERLGGLKDVERGHLLPGDCDPAESLGLQADKAEHPSVVAIGLHGLDSHRLVEKRAGDDLA